MEATEDISKSIDQYTNAFSKNIMQVAVFKAGDENYYGMNINKINYFAIYKNLDIIQMYGTRYVIGYFNFNGKVIALVNLCEWLHRDTDTSNFTRVIVCEFSGTQMGFLVSDIYKIYDKTSDKLEEVSTMKNKVTYATKIDIDGKKDKICLILDVENLYLEIHPSSSRLKMDLLESYHFNYKKTLLIAEDSTAIQTYIRNIFDKFNTSYILFNNGKQIIDYMENHQGAMKNIDIIITDIEMPIMDGFQVIKYVKNKEYLSHIKVIVHTSMSNESVNAKVESLGADDFVRKMDPLHLLDSIKKFDNEGQYL